MLGEHKIGEAILGEQGWGPGMIACQGSLNR